MDFQFFQDLSHTGTTTNILLEDQATAERTLKFIHTSKAPEPIGPYSQGVVSSSFIFTAGLIAIDPATSKIVEGGVKEQTNRILESMRAILEKAGSSMDKVVKTTVYLKEASLFREMNEIYSNFFGDHKPARSTVVCDFMRENVLVEIDAIAEV